MPHFYLSALFFARTSRISNVLPLQLRYEHVTRNQFKSLLSSYYKDALILRFDIKDPRTWKSDYLKLIPNATFQSLFHVVISLIYFTILFITLTSFFFFFFFWFFLLHTLLPIWWISNNFIPYKLCCLVFVYCVCRPKLAVNISIDWLSIIINFISYSRQAVLSCFTF